MGYWNCNYFRSRDDQFILIATIASIGQASTNPLLPATLPCLTHRFTLPLHVTTIWWSLWCHPWQSISCNWRSKRMAGIGVSFCPLLTGIYTYSTTAPYHSILRLGQTWRGFGRHLPLKYVRVHVLYGIPGMGKVRGRGGGWGEPLPTKWLQNISSSMPSGTRSKTCLWTDILSEVWKIIPTRYGEGGGG